MDIKIEKEWCHIRPDIFLFSESPGFLLEVRADSEDRFLEAMDSAGLTVYKIGRVTESRVANILVDDLRLPQLDLSELGNQWRAGLDQLIF